MAQKNIGMVTTRMEEKWKNGDSHDEAGERTSVKL